jgi:Immunoglobulin-like domain of bacterial spore germination/Sporulation and spore germination
MKRLSLMITLVALLGAACAGGAGSLGAAPSGSSSPSTSSPASPSPISPSPTPTRVVTPAPTVSARTIALQVWFVRSSKLFLTERNVPATQAIGRAALSQLLAGPSDVERRAGVTSSVPSGTTLLGLAIRDGIAFVDFNAAFRGNGDIAPILVGQVVWTIGQFSTVDKVVIKVEGAEIYETPQTTDEYERFLPAISVQSPSIGETVSSPVTVSGSANVFEATVSLRILDSNGHEVARGFTTATCGTGCRGTYSTTLSYHVDHDQPGKVQVYESSAKDGSAINVVSIPVTLTA